MKSFFKSLAVIMSISAGCGAQSPGYVVKCIDGVEYISGNRKMSVKYNTDSTVSTCEGL